MDDVTESSGGASEEAPNGASLTRRGLLQGAAASSILLTSEAWTAMADRYDLALTLSQKDTLLIVSERPIFEGSNKVTDDRTSNPTWFVHAAFFGPKAWFDLVKPTSEDRRTLKIHNCSYGNGVAEFVFEFSRKQRKDHWNIDYHTNLWNPAERALPGGAEFAKTTFADFAKSIKPLKRRIAPGQINAVLQRAFRGHVRVARQPAATFDIAFDSRLQWTLSSANSRSFVLFDGQAFLKEFSFGWRTDLDEIADGVITGDTFLTGRGSVHHDGFENSKIVVGAGHYADVSLRQQESIREFEVRVGPYPLDPLLDQVVSRLTLGQAQISIMNAQGALTGAVSCSDLVLAQTILPKVTKSTRTVLFGSAGLATDPAMKSLPPGEEIIAPIGRLIVAALPPDQAAKIAEAEKRPVAGAPPAPANGKAKDDPLARRKAEAAARKKERELFFRAACGDRGGARKSTLWIVDDLRSGKPAGTERQLRRVAIDLQLRAANVALPDVSFSSLAFSEGGADLRLVSEDGDVLSELAPAGEFPRAQPSSFVWVGPSTGSRRGEIDLTRATLTAARDYDLAKLRFRFFDLVLTFTPSALHSASLVPLIRPARADCRLIWTEDGKFEDSRPVFVAEFDPQHVFEEALFRPEPRPLPDAQIKDGGKPVTREMILEELARLRDDSKELIKYREEIRFRKRLADAVNPNPAGPIFELFADRYEKKAAAAGLPEDQRIYIGPYGLDPDAMHIARDLFKIELRSHVVAVVKQSFERVNVVIASLRAADVSSPTKKAVRFLDPQILDNALRNESTIEGIEPVYAAFRSFYRDERSKSADVAIPGRKNAEERPLQEFLWQTEFLAEANRPAGPSDPIGTVTRQLWFDQVFEPFIDRVVGAEKIKDLTAARLSGPSRLAFRVNCMPPPNATGQEAGLRESSGASPSAPSGGGFDYDPIPFTFEALTDWSRHEPAVTRRAQKLFTALPWGVVPPLGERAANLSDHDILAFQGFTKGFITAEQRLGEVRASMARKPARFETAIEIPSRLVLSTAQDAVWQTVRRLPASATDLNKGEKVPTKKAPLLESGQRKQVEGKTSIYRAPLWSARLSVEDVNPSLRIIDTPDFRPMVLASARTNPPLPGRGAPPRGPIAPWFVGPEQMESTTVTADDINTHLPVDAPGRVPQGDVCGPSTPDAPSLPEKVFQVLKWLCGRAEARNGTPIDWRMFRTTLDAYDRHQLVMLSSAYGLPVIGKRQAAGNDVDAVGPLVVDSGQFEPGSENEYALSDARNDQAIYRPVPLNVRELSLTALGGSFSHDTAFQPSAGADDLWGRKLFEGFSIERWQQDIVLGRDVLGQVVYKGYLLPFGHRASMIKQTERIFLRTPNQGVKAILRQRIFLHVAQPLQRFPAIGQPHRGAMWCAESVTLRTIWTPDILDPNSAPIVKDGESLNGRIDLGAGNPGLAFFPRTDITERGLVSFELLVDGAATRLPLVFVDNIAATTASSLGKLIELYTSKKWVDRRTLPINGQKIRFAPENRSGDTTLVTESIQVAAHGRFKDFGGGWAGNLDTYNTTGTLEGARQPPFYPAMDFAIVRLEQVERFSGNERKPVKVQYDGHYVRHGFAQIPAADAKGGEAQPKWNPSEVFLNLRRIVSSSMGDNGARAAAIGRPASHICAVSRSKGPLGADRFVKYEMLGSDDPTSQAADPQSKTIAIKGAPEAVELFDDEEGWQRLRSLASYFNHRHELSAKDPDTGSDYPQVVSQPPGPVDVLPPADNRVGEVLKTLQVLQSYFSGEAKILGTVKIKYLLALLDLDDVLGAVPILRETVEYGTAALSKINDQASDLATDVRTRVIHPLTAVVTRLRAQWTVLDATLAAKVGQSANSGLTLAKIYPEIDSGLSDLERTLQAASIETDPARLAQDLAIVYESGRRFMRVLATIAANPVERLKDAATHAIDNLVSGFSGDFQSLAEFTKQVEDVIKAVQKLTVADLETWILQNVDTAALTEKLSLNFEQPDLVALANNLGVTLDAAEQALLEDIAKQLNAALPTANRLIQLLVPNALDVLTGKKKPDDAFQEAVKTWISEQRPALDQAVADAKTRIGAAGVIKVEALRLAALDKLEELRGRINEWLVAKILPDRDRLLEAVGRALVLFAEVDAIAKAAGSGDVTGVIRAAGVFSSDLFGYDISILPANVVAEYTKKIIDVRERLRQFALSVAIVNAAEKKVLAAELEGCLTFRTVPATKLPVASPPQPAPLNRPPLSQIIQALEGLDSLGKPISDFELTLVDLPPSDALTDLKRFHGDLTTFVADLVTNTKKLYCSGVETLVLLNEIKDWFASGPWTSLDRGELDQLTRVFSRVERSVTSIGTALTAMAQTIAGFVNNPANRQYRDLAGGLLLVGGAARLIDITPPGGNANQIAKKLKDSGAEVETRIAVALANVLVFVFKLANDGSLFGAQVAGDFEKAVIAVRSGLASADRELGASAGDLVTALHTLGLRLTELAQLKLQKAPGNYGTIKELLDERIDVLQLTLKEALANPAAGKNVLQEFVGDARKAESDALALWRLLELKIRGAPEKIKQDLENRVLGASVRLLATGYGKLLELRRKAIEMISGVPLLSAQAKHALIVKPAYGAVCNIEDPNGDPNDLAKCDRLSEEADILAKFEPPDQAKRNKVLRFFASWTNNTAAPLTIATHVRDLAAQVLKGDILSLIDVSAFRDAIDDAIAQLIPTRTTLAYDFSRAIQKEPSKTALFQAQKGTVFALRVRAVVDLLQPDKVDFRATGSLGPFDVRLVGNLIDALTLKFDGAVFEMVGGGSPHFDVAYKDFVIGEDLKFAQQLQSFLSPKDGSGIFLQPLTRTAGIEAGYGIDLGSIGVGVTSFFNVTLNVSAELPFTDSESLFKVSLGRRLRPFTMSVVPFAGSGYFSIFAAPDGIRGFEASFEFGGGASLGFGPLQAQVRVMVGVFVRVLRVDNTNTCTIYGTFFAGGSASIWIFSFSTSLYVRLGRGDDGTMYGEAIYSFSFSLGIVDYDYSITAFRREQPIGGGGGKQKQSSLMEPEEFDAPVRLALADDVAVMSDAGPALYTPRKIKRQPPKPSSARPLVGHSAPRPTNYSDVTSLAVGPDRNLTTYLSYFDLGLLEGA